MFSPLLVGFAGLLSSALACDNCYGPSNVIQHPRHSRRMQPEALNATVAPSRPLEWGQLNFLHTTDTHGWLEGHLKEQNYGADWGDFVSFSQHLQQKASSLGVDLLLVDTGDLHDGNGLSDATALDGVLSNPIFENINYDLLTIGNHELYLANVAYETFFNFSSFYSDRYVTSNVQILNPTTGAFQHIGQQYRYFTTKYGLRIMAFGVLYDFTGNTNVTKVIKTADLVKQPWFLSAVNFSQPIDLFLVLGHNPVRPTAGGSTFGTLYNTIRHLRPNVPIQAFGGHSHVRDFVVYDQMSTGLESGRYCETLGFLSLSGIHSSNFTGNIRPVGVPNPTTKAVALVAASATISAGLPSSTATAFNSTLFYSRRYLDWNRLTFAYHAVGSQDTTFDYANGLRVTGDITETRKQLNLATLYGCAPATYCASCKPFGTDGNIYSSLLPVALSATVINATRATVPRIIIINSGSIRFDLVQGPFTYDDSFIVSPFTDGFQYIPAIPYSIASQVLGQLNSAPEDSKRDLGPADFDFGSLTGDLCPDGSLISPHPESVSNMHGLTRGLHRRQSSTLTPGYTTKDDFGTDGDDTPHSRIPAYPQPVYIQANGSFPTDGSTPATVDLIFLDFFAEDVLSILTGLGVDYTAGDATYYLDESTFTTQSYLPAYARKVWQANVPNCPTGEGATK